MLRQFVFMRKMVSRIWNQKHLISEMDTLWMIIFFRNPFKNKVLINQNRKSLRFVMAFFYVVNKVIQVRK